MMIIKGFFLIYLIPIIGALSVVMCFYLPLVLIWRYFDRPIPNRDITGVVAYEGEIFRGTITKKRHNAYRRFIKLRAGSCNYPSLDALESGAYDRYHAKWSILFEKMNEAKSNYDYRAGRWISHMMSDRYKSGNYYGNP